MPSAHRSFTALAATLAASLGALLLLHGSALAESPAPPGQIGAPVAVADPDGFRPTLSGCGVTVVAPVNSGLDQEVVELLNQQRLANGSLPPLKRVNLLDNAARYHSTDMIQDNYFDHGTYDRINNILTLTCDFAQRINSFYSGWSAVGENIAAGQTTPTQAMTAWMNSAGHRANILSTAYWETGAGYASGGSYRHYWTNDFGRRRNVYPLVINREAASTNLANVQLYVYGSWSEIRLRNENGSFGAWQPFGNHLSWTLSAGAAGPRTVSAELRTGSTTASASDDILLSSGSTGPSATPVPPTVASTATRTSTPIPTATHSATPVPTSTRTPTAIPSATHTATPLPTATRTPMPLATATRTATPPPTGVPTTVARGDCNADGGLNAADLSSLSLELWDEDGPDAASAGQGSFPGSPVGCDSNRDATITVADLSCTVLIIFDGPAACP